MRRTVRRPNRYLRASAQQVDPLSWFTGPYLPLSFAALIAVFSTVVTLLTWDQSRLPWLQFVGAAFCVSAALLIHASTRPFRPPLRWPSAAIALAISICGLSISAYGYAGSDFHLELWWGIGGLGLTIMSLAPYLPARQILAVGGAATAAAALITFFMLYPNPQGWGPITTAVFLTYPLVAAVTATAAFSYAIVSRTVPLLEDPSTLLVPFDEEVSEERYEQHKAGVARLTARAVPFIEKVVEAGRITPSDRVLAGQLARRIREELVTAVDVSWLDSVLAGKRVVIVDPSRRAARMNHRQRVALGGLIEAILEMPETDLGSVLLELRPAKNGATAVAVSLDVDLPEGPRIMHLAPYYLTLKTAVQDLAIGRKGLSFSIGPEDRQS